MQFIWDIEVPAKPKSCRFCGLPLEQEEGGVAWRCTNPDFPFPVLFCPDNPADFPVHEPEEAMRGE